MNFIIYYSLKIKKNVTIFIVSIQVQYRHIKGEKMKTIGKLVLAFALLAVLFSAVPANSARASDPLASIMGVVIKPMQNGNYAVITTRMPSNNWMAYRVTSVDGSRLNVTVYRRNVPRVCPMLKRVTVLIPDSITKLYVNGMNWSSLLRK